MKFALFLGCTVPARLKEYEISSRRVLRELGVELVDIPEFNCCGYPLRNIDFKAFVLSAARNLALAESHGLNMLSLCKCGYGTMRMADYVMMENASLRKEINAILAKEGLKYEAEIQIMHLLTVLYKEVGVDAIGEKITRHYENLKIAAHYGCHALRPSSVVQFDDPVAPSLFDQLVEVTGAESVKWQAQLECCGGPLSGTNDDLSLDLAEKKLADAKRAGAEYLATACPFCQLQFDTAQKMNKSERRANHHIPSILYPQLLGLCMGMDKEGLGIDSGRVDMTEIENFLGG
ncbi:MAG: CoB--CoM heterodisulfide reductase iron-sulfur subunit B family protein [Desulfobacterales bacterium]|nr:CoB--CoM heterodisulfide reductase iron-sulfur subunit B family protein [Desulfobacterales bacterium]